MKTKIYKNGEVNLTSQTIHQALAKHGVEHWLKTSGAMSHAKQSALASLAIYLVGKRKPRETARSWGVRASAAVNA